MTIFNLDYYNDEGGYSDGSVETDLLHLFKEGKSAEEILKSDLSWPYIYHLSSIRSNILSWFPFKKDCSILEVGSGCGALTEVLSKKAKEVTSIELTKPRAEVNYYRNKDLENVEIIVGNFNSIKLDKKYDYIILNGVLEYAGSFTQSENPYFSFLESLKKHLKKDGALIIAIENRIGLKYLNGAPEDHTGVLFSGINNYTGVNSVRTFSKIELIELLKKTGFKTIDFFYPYPDYKLPEVIFTDETLNLINPSNAEVSYNFNRLKFYDEDKMIKTLNFEGILDRFVNSFLVVCSDEKQDFKSVIYAKFSPNRDKRFALMTTIEKDGDKKIVRKTPIFPEGKDHLNQIYQNYLRHKNDEQFTPVKAELSDNSIIFDFINQETLEKKLADLVIQKDWDKLQKELKQLKEYFIEGSEFTKDGYTKEFKEIFGDIELDRPLHFKTNSSFDMLLSNIMDDESHHLIDYEWEFDFPIPQEYIYFRLLYYFYLQENLADQISLIDLMKLTDDEGEDPFISMNDFETFLDWDSNFGINYVKGSYIENKPMVTEDSEEIFQKAWQRTDITSSLYFDFGDGFSEDDRIKLDLITDDDGKFKITFDLSALDNINTKDIATIRWDPLETYMVLEDFKAYSNKGPLQNLTYPPFTSLCIYEDNKYTFVTEDPMILLYGDYKDLKTITIEGKIQKLSMDDVYEELYRIHNLRQQLKNDNKLIQDELDRNRLELINYDNALNNLINKKN